MRVLIAGIAGASLGTEIAKALRLAGGHTVVGCDISKLAYGHYDPAFDTTVVVDRSDYIGSLLRICADLSVEAVIAGANETARLIGEATESFEAAGVAVCQNAPSVVELCSDKASCFARLGALGIDIPKTQEIKKIADLDDFPMPCVVKPAVDSGGSAFVFYARNRTEAELYSQYLLNNEKRPIVQAYLDHRPGEFTVGVLSLKNSTIVGSAAMRRSFSNKLSVAACGRDFLISSGYSQGEIREFPSVRQTAESIAHAIGSVGPLNVQGRMTNDGRFVPFEINPRFSATTYLRALAGFNEVDAFLRHLGGQSFPRVLKAKPGWYLRSLTEARVEVLVGGP